MQPAIKKKSDKQSRVDGKMKRMLEPSIKLIGELHRMIVSGVRI